MTPVHAMPKPETPTVLTLLDQARRFDAATRFEPTHRRAEVDRIAAAQLRLVATLVKSGVYTIQDGREWLRAAQITHHRIALARTEQQKATR